MTVPRQVLLIVGSLALAALLLAGFAYLDRGERRYVFINETNDHRFDEAIRTSILAATQKTGVQNAVVITNRDYRGNIEMEAAEVFKELRIGKQLKGRGILYLFHPARQELKIEVGYALEGVLPDIALRGLELAAKTFTYADRYQDFWAELLNTVNIEIYEKEKGQSSSSLSDLTDFQFLSGGAALTSRSYNDTWEQLLAESQFAEDQPKEYVALEKAAGVVSSYLESMQEGIGDGNLDLLTPESRVFRRFTPLTSYQLTRNWRMANQAGIDRIFEEKDLAIAFFKPNHPVLPIVLVRNGKLWRVSEPLSWSLFQRFEERVYPKFALSEISSGLSDYLTSRLGHPIYPALAIPASYLVATPDLRSWKSLYFHLYWLDKVEREAPEHLGDLKTDDLWILADSALSIGNISAFLQRYKMAAGQVQENQAVQKKLKFYLKTLPFNPAEWRLKF